MLKFLNLSKKKKKKNIPGGAEIMTGISGKYTPSAFSSQSPLLFPLLSFSPCSSCTISIPHLQCLSDEKGRHEESDMSHGDVMDSPVSAASPDPESSAGKNVASGADKDSNTIPSKDVEVSCGRAFDIILSSLPRYTKYISNLHLRALPISALRILWSTDCSNCN